MDVCKQKLILCLCDIQLSICEWFPGIQPHLPAPTEEGAVAVVPVFHHGNDVTHIPGQLGCSSNLWIPDLGEMGVGLTLFVGELGAFHSVYPPGCISGCPPAASLDLLFPDICQDTNQTLFKPCQGSEEVPCNKPVPVSLSEEPCCPLHLRLPPQMYVPEQVLAVPQELGAAPTDLYLSAAELQPTESLPLEFSDVSGKDAPLPT